MNLKKRELKELWGAAGNECAHPKCNEEIVDVQNGFVIGQMAHIRGESEGGPRYDPSQDDDERNSPSNLVLLCPTHHRKADKYPDDYPAETLNEWKEQQIAQDPVNPDRLTDDLVQEFVNHSENIEITDGSFIVTNNQMGGQVAHEITNEGPQPRTISSAAQQQMSQILAKYDPSDVRVTAKNNSEAEQLGRQIMSVLENAGWVITGLDKLFGSSDSKTGIIVKTPEQTEVAERLVILFREAGFATEGIIYEGNRLDIVVRDRPV